MKYIDLEEFVSEGYLQELNRGFLHPHGLALVVEFYPDGTYVLKGIWDARDDPHGMIFDCLGDDECRSKAENVARLRERRRGAREKEFGWWQQPIG